MSAIPLVSLTADIFVAPYCRARTAPITIAPSPSTTTGARAAVSSLEACPTPALRSVQTDALARVRAGVRQPLTIASNSKVDSVAALIP